MSAADTKTRAEAGSLKRRAIAALIDGIPVIGIIALQAWASVTVPTITQQGRTLSDQEVVAMFASLTLVVINLWMVYLFLTTHLGRSLGKWLMGLRVVGAESGSAPTWKQAFLREVFAKVVGPMLLIGLLFPPAVIAVPLILLWPAFWRDDRRALHDRISKTLVIADPRTSKPGGITPPPSA